MMIRTLVAAAVAGCLIVPASVDAATRHVHKRHNGYYGGVWHDAPVGLGYGAYGYRGYGYRGTPPMAGPPWSGPNQCWEDLGYGRYEKCNW